MKPIKPSGRVSVKRMGIPFRGFKVSKPHIIVLFGVILTLLVSGSLVYHQWYRKTLSSVPANQQQFLGIASVDTKQISETKDSYVFSQKDAKKQVEQAEVVAGTSDATGDIAYDAVVSKKMSSGIQFSSTNDSRGFTIRPLGVSAEGYLDSGRVVYPLSPSERHVYTFKRNGLKEDILLAKPSSNSRQFKWKLDLGNELEARVLPDGSIGIYSASAYLFGNNISISDEKSQTLVDNAKKNGKKDTLVFVMPRPFITDQTEKKNYQDVSYSLKAGTLILEARNLRSMKYPLSIDPTVTVTTTNEFGVGNVAGQLIDTSIGSQITRGAVSTGSLSSSFITSSNYFSNPRDAAGVVVYNGFIYITGGQMPAVSTTCKDPGSSPPSALECSDVQYAAINSDGSIGSFTLASFYFTFPRMGHFATAYNGYLYIVGGRQIITNSDTNCKNTGLLSNRCNDIQRAAINSDGSINSFVVNTTTYFTTPRYFHYGAVYNGYMYIFGGEEPTTSTTGCKNTGVSENQCNDTQYAPINADGSIGSFTTTSYFSYPRRALAGAAYNGYLYVSGGIGNISSVLCKNAGSSTLCNDVQYAPINADGSIGTWQNTSFFTTTRRGHVISASKGYFYVAGGINGTYQKDVQYAPINSDGTLGSFATDAQPMPIAKTQMSVAVYNGYLYMLGGDQSVSTTSCKNTGVASAKCNEVIYASISTGTVTGFGTNGTPWTTDAGGNFTSIRQSHTSVAYNGYLYVIGGTNGSEFADVQYAPINVDGSVGAWASTTSFTTARANHTSVAYNGYLYVIGGSTASTSACKNAGTSIECNDVQFAPINSNGTVGTWTASSYFNNPRHNHTTVLYNGYMYILGGLNTVSLNDVQFARVNANGSVGAWNYTHASINDGTTFVSGFTSIRNNHASVAYNGYIYVLGGFASPTYFGDTQYAPINADGTIGTWVTNATNFTIARANFASVAFNGYIYVIGGCSVGTCTTYQSDVQSAPINADGSIGTWATTNAFTTARMEHTAVVYDGYLYVVGGTNGTLQNDTQYDGLKTPDQRVLYERVFDTGSSANTINSFVINGTTVCPMSVTYRTAAAAAYGADTVIPSVLPGVAYNITVASKRYVLLAITLDDSKCGARTTISDIQVVYNATVSAPSLLLPANNATGVAILPEFRLASTDEAGDYLRYKIDVCSTNTCSVIVRAIDQTASQTGWQSQDTQSSSAYSSGVSITQVASHIYQPAALTASTQYWWRAFAIDPGGTNTLSAASSILTFTTGSATPSQVNIQGGTTIIGGTTL